MRPEFVYDRDTDTVMNVATPRDAFVIRSDGSCGLGAVGLHPERVYQAFLLWQCSRP